jgi:hypothetical protein
MIGGYSDDVVIEDGYFEEGQIGPDAKADLVADDSEDESEDAEGDIESDDET